MVVKKNVELQVLLYYDQMSIKHKLCLNSSWNISLLLLLTGQLFFRLSATILKLLENEEDDGEQSEQQMKLLDHELFFNMLAEAAVRPFARGEEKTTPKTSIDKYDHKPFRPCLH